MSPCSVMSPYTCPCFIASNTKDLFFLDYPDQLISTKEVQHSISVESTSTSMKLEAIPFESMPLIESPILGRMMKDIGKQDNTRPLQAYSSSRKKLPLY